MKRKLHTFGLITQRLRSGTILFIFIILFFLASNSIQAADTNTASLSISPSQINLLNNTLETNTIDLDSGPETIGFVHTEIIFNPDIVQLATEVLPSPLFSTVIQVTSMTEANETGVIDITLGVSSQSFSNAPSGKINIALLNWVTNTNPANQITNISFVQNANQVVNIQDVSLPIQTQDGIIVINNPTPTAISTLTALPTSTPTLTPTPTPTTPPLNGDANGDGKVDGIDYVIWLTHYSQSISGGRSVGDFNLNGKIDGIDYVIWLNAYTG